MNANNRQSEKKLFWSGRFLYFRREFYPRSTRSNFASLTLRFDKSHYHDYGSCFWVRSFATFSAPVNMRRNLKSIKNPGLRIGSKLIKSLIWMKKDHNQAYRQIKHFSFKTIIILVNLNQVFVYLQRKQFLKKISSFSNWLNGLTVDVN